jgi:hypothetical protein
LQSSVGRRAAALLHGPMKTAATMQLLLLLLPLVPLSDVQMFMLSQP